MTFRPILVKKTNCEKLFVKDPNNPPLFFVKTFINVNNSKIFLKKLLLKSLIGIALIYHGFIIRLFAKIFNLQKWKRLEIKKDRVKILNYCLDDLNSLAKKYNKKINLIHLPACNRKISDLEKLSNIDKKTIINFVNKNEQIKYFYLEKSEKEFLKFANNNELDKIFWTDTNHPNNKGSKIIAEEISNLIK